jgi:hypothetical protein
VATYRHRALISVPGAGTRDASEVWVPGGSTTLYDGPADVQDAGYGTRRSDDGSFDIENGGWVFLPKDTSLAAIRGGDDGMLVTLQFGDDRGTREARILEVAEDEVALAVEWIG